MNMYFYNIFSLGVSFVLSCVCKKGQISDGTFCYGNIIERILELNTESRHKGKLTSAINMFGMSLSS